MIITSNNIPPEVKAPTSKSFANRALILSALFENDITLINLPKANDVSDMIKALKEVGIVIENQNEKSIVRGVFPECESLTYGNKIKLDLGEGGTTVRFLFVFLSLGRKEYHVKLKGEMANRPIGELVRCLSDLGAKITIKDNSNYIIQGPIDLNNSVEVDCSKTTQFSSALMLVSKLQTLNITNKNLTSSKKYIDLTKSLIKRFLNNETSFSIPVDFSGLSYILAESLFNNSTCVSNLFEIDKLQADSILLDIIKDVGGRYTITDKGLTISPIKNLNYNLNIDGSNCLDLVPTLMFIGSKLKGVTTLKNIKNLKYKECDRLAEMMNILDHFSVKFKYDGEEDVFKIFPSTIRAKHSEYKTLDDHRMVMILTLFTRASGGGKISPHESVNKSFQDFFDIFT